MSAANESRPGAASMWESLPLPYDPHALMPSLDTPTTHQGPTKSTGAEDRPISSLLRALFRALAAWPA
jgi:hypothetical protein